MVDSWNSSSATKPWTPQEIAIMKHDHWRSPQWTCDPNRLREWIRRVDEWKPGTRVKEHQFGATFLMYSDARMREVLRAYPDYLERLRATKWREAVSADDHIQYQYQKAKELRDAYREQTRNLNELAIYYSSVDAWTARSKGAGKGVPVVATASAGPAGDEDEDAAAPGPEAPPQNASHYRVKALRTYKEDPTTPDFVDYSKSDITAINKEDSVLLVDITTKYKDVTVPAGDHEVYGPGYGDVMTSNGDFFIEVCKEKFSKPSVMVWQQKRNHYQNLRRKQPGGATLSWLRYFDLFEARARELREDSGGPADYTLSEATMANDVWVHAGLTAEDLTTLTHSDRTWQMNNYTDMKKLLLLVFHETKQYADALKPRNAFAVLDSQGSVSFYQDDNFQPISVEEVEENSHAWSVQETPTWETGDHAYGVDSSWDDEYGDNPEFYDLSEEDQAYVVCVRQWYANGVARWVCHACQAFVPDSHLDPETRHIRMQDSEVDSESSGHVPPAFVWSDSDIPR